MDVAHEPQRERALGAEIVSAERELGDLTLTDDSGQALQRADVRDHRHLRLADPEGDVRGGDADVARREQIDAAAETPAVRDRDHGLLAARDGRHGTLDLQDEVEQALARTGAIAALDDA